MEEKERQSGSAGRAVICERWNEKSQEGYRTEGIKIGKKAEGGKRKKEESDGDTIGAVNRKEMDKKLQRAQFGKTEQ